ncbi:MAG: YraN family protein [Chloroflexi bacterium]|jgi:putative endonuclease|nr:YraN family protein [Chloroflexota bacterium]MBT7081664.1 YraN family protein [Chloroflexota bacterium]MBT7290525.1 YraN family protein [Chloroflexota bacterium]
MTSERRRTGDLGESIATDFLSKAGYKILARNFSCRYGEIDIIAENKDCTVFVEVRTKKSYRFGTPGESITQAKKINLF